MPSEERQRIIESNKSLRLIKNELESLLEKGVISDAAYDAMIGQLPAESPLSGHPTPHATGANSLASPTPSALASRATPSPQPAAAAPVVPPPAPAPAQQPVLEYVRALYRYAGSDARDCSFERDDRLAVLEHMNDDWWLGRNLRTGQQGIFPRTYVAVEPHMDEKGAAAGFYGPYGGGAAGTAAQAGQGQQNPYNSSVPPMAMANPSGGGQQPQQLGPMPPPGKFEAGARKFGRKLGNAAIFGAGVTIGSDIVNSII